MSQKIRKIANFYRDEHVHLELHLNLIKDGQTVEFSPGVYLDACRKNGYECRMSDADLLCISSGAYEAAFYDRCCESVSSWISGS